MVSPFPMQADGPDRRDMQAQDWRGLPEAGVGRWVPARKAAVAAALRDGRITRDAACARWGLSPQEIALWLSALDRGGAAALRVTHLQHARRRAA